jgi:hypothetical protein
MTQTEKILNCLMQGHRLTHLEALDAFDCTRLAARIKDIKNMGYPVESELVKTPTGKLIAQYSLPRPQQAELNLA